MKMYTLFYYDPQEEKGDITLWAKDEEQAEERFYETHRRYVPGGKPGYEVVRIMEGEI